MPLKYVSLEEYQRVRGKKHQPDLRNLSFRELLSVLFTLINTFIFSTIVMWAVELIFSLPRFVTVIVWFVVFHRINVFVLSRRKVEIVYKIDSSEEAYLVSGNVFIPVYLTKRGAHYYWKTAEVSIFMIGWDKALFRSLTFEEWVEFRDG